MTEPVWTLETLKEYFDALREADKKAVDTALASAEKAVAAAMNASEKTILKEAFPPEPENPPDMEELLRDLSRTES